VRLLTLRLTISLIVGITLISLFSSYYEVRFQKRGLRRDLEHRAEVLGESLADKVEPYLKKGSRKDLQVIVERFGNREHLTGVVVYNPQGLSIAVTPDLAPRLPVEPPVVRQAASSGQSAGEYIRLGEASVYIYAVPLHQGEAVVGVLAIIHDAGYINAQSRRVWRNTFLRVLVLVFLITLTTLLIVRSSIAGPIARAAQWMRALRVGKASSRPSASDLDLFRPLANEMATFAASLTAARSAAEQEAQLRQAGDTFWTAE
jgi:sensor histidine kinase regulating citrate/malate metabolism